MNNIEAYLDFLECSNRDLREQFDGAHETVVKLWDKGREIRDGLLARVEREQGLTQDELVEVYLQVNKIFGGRVRKSDPCPYDTNGDGDCGRRYCPHCGETTRVTKAPSVTLDPHV